MTATIRNARVDLTWTWAAKFGLHVGLLFLGFTLAYYLRRPLPVEWWLTNPDAGRVVGWAGLFALIGACVELFFQSERSAWRFASMREVVGLVRNVTLTTGLFLGLIFFFDRGVQLPRSVLPLSWLVSLALLVGSRMVWRLPHDRSLVSHFLPSWWPRSTANRTPMLIVGPMAAVDRQLRLLQNDPNGIYETVGVITPNAEEVGLRLHGVPFTSTLSEWSPARSGLTVRGAARHAILFLDDPVQGYGLSTERIGELRKSGHTLLKPHSLTEIDGATDAGNFLKEIPLEDFLPRQPISLDATPIRSLVAGRRIMVTGAGGSIGSELCRQLLALDCAHLSMVDHSEYLLFEIDRELANGGTGSRRAVLANVRDADRIDDVVRAECPDIIFHAAALKHVALVENNPAEGVLTNVRGTWNVLQAAQAHGASQFVLISTDKAVAPTNVMGATKRIAEALLDLAPKSATRMTAVRFGNVLGSAGSVVPIFRDQIARGGPVTVTHPEVTRYFMTIPEAVQLVLHSAAIGSGLESEKPCKFLLEMGDPVRIVDLARQMIELTGQRADVDIKIEFSGLKPGEKLAEVLTDDGETVRPCVEGILQVMWSPRADELSISDINELISQAERGDRAVKQGALDLADVVRSSGQRRSGPQVST